jgi:ABC-type molybdate transport system ATPase subunit
MRRIGERVRARIRARDVSLSVQRPTEISMLNVLRAQ